MTTQARKLLISEYKNYQREAAGLNIYFNIDGNNMMKWEAMIFGPDDTEWEGGVFFLNIEFKETYPIDPPKVSFKYPKMFHPNIYANGEICLDILQKGWTQAYNMLAVMKSIQSLLTDPNTSSPANTDAAKLFDTDKEEYYRRVKECAMASLICQQSFNAC